MVRWYIDMKLNPVLASLRDYCRVTWEHLFKDQDSGIQCHMPWMLLICEVLA